MALASWLTRGSPSFLRRIWKVPGRRVLTTSPKLGLEITVDEVRHHHVLFQNRQTFVSPNLGNQGMIVSRGTHDRGLREISVLQVAVLGQAARTLRWGSGVKAFKLIRPLEPAASPAVDELEPMQMLLKRPPYRAGSSFMRLTASSGMRLSSPCPWWHQRPGIQ